MSIYARLSGQKISIEQIEPFEVEDRKNLDVLIQDFANSEKIPLIEGGDHFKSIAEAKGPYEDLVDESDKRRARLQSLKGTLRFMFDKIQNYALYFIKDEGVIVGAAKISSEECVPNDECYSPLIDEAFTHPKYADSGEELQQKLKEALEEKLLDAHGDNDGIGRWIVVDESKPIGKEYRYGLD